MKSFLRYGLCGAAAGLANGFFGAGGGILLVPLLLKFGQLDDREVFPTSLSIMVPLALVSLTVHLLRGSPALSGTLPYVLGGILGGLFGGRCFQKVPLRWLHLIFGLFLLWGGIRLWM